MVHSSRFIASLLFASVPVFAFAGCASEEAAPLEDPPGLIATEDGYFVDGYAFDGDDESGIDVGEEGEVGTTSQGLSRASTCGAICGGAGARVCLPLRHPFGAVACGVASSIACSAVCGGGSRRPICKTPRKGSRCLVYGREIYQGASGAFHPCYGWTC